jgi:hypothetical protein
LPPFLGGRLHALDVHERNLDDSERPLVVVDDLDRVAEGYCFCVYSATKTPTIWRLPSERRTRTRRPR